MIRPRRAKHAVVISPTPAGSIGDQAMIDVVATYLTEVRGYEVSIVPNKHKTRLPGGTYPSTKMGRFVNAVTKTIRADFTGFVGADVLDGVYGSQTVLKRLRLLRLGQRTGSRTRVFGSSFSTTPSQDNVSFLRGASDIEVLARDPISKGRMEAATGRSIKLVADLAFQLRPELTSPTALAAADWMDERRRNHGTILGVNFGGPIAKIDSARAASCVALAITNFLRRSEDRSVLFMPHDWREGQVGDIQSLNEVVAAMPTDLTDRFHLLRAPFDAWDLKALAGKLDFVFTSRMHLAIAALGMGVPPLCIVYQGKFEGLMQHFGLTGLTVEPAICLQPEALDAALERVLSNAPLLRSQIAAALPGVMELSRANFDGI